jgi:hypothetical protein
VLLLALRRVYFVVWVGLSCVGIDEVNTCLEVFGCSVHKGERTARRRKRRKEGRMRERTRGRYTEEGKRMGEGGGRGTSKVVEESVDDSDEKDIDSDEKRGREKGGKLVSYAQVDC